MVHVLSALRVRVDGRGARARRGLIGASAHIGAGESNWGLLRVDCADE